MRYFVALSLLLSLAAHASRNTAGNYTLPSGNPVVSGTTITSTWANGTLSDIKTEITNSLSRDGYGAMRAALKVPDGSSAAPTLTFSSDPASGLYLSTASDVRMSVASADVFRWTASTSYALNALTCSKGVTVTNSTTNGAGITSTGNGTGAGLVATGGSTGRGATISAGGGNAAGAVVTGAGSGTGLSATGGSSAGVGLDALGGSGGGIGVNATGTGAAGVRARSTGGAVGLDAAGSGSSAGGTFANGTAATGSTPQNALTLTNGYLSMSGVANPNSTVGFANTLTPLNTPKAWAKITTAGTGSTSATVGAGFNISSASVNGTTLTVNLATAVNSTCSALVTPGLSSHDLACEADCTGTAVSIVCTNVGGSTMPFGSYNFQVAGARNLHMVVYGAQ